MSKYVFILCPNLITIEGTGDRYEFDMGTSLDHNHSEGLHQSH